MTSRPYADAAESLRARRDRLAADLGEARDAAREATERAARVPLLEKELAETERLLRSVAGPRGLPLLDDVRIASPCSARWEHMAGDERVRFCGSCEKNVYNLSAMPRAEAEALLVAGDGKMCVRVYKRADGTVLTADCPVGARRQRRRRVAAGVVGGSLLVAAALAVGTERVTSDPAPVETMGELPLPPSPPQTSGAAVTPPPPAAAPHALMGRRSR